MAPKTEASASSASASSASASSAAGAAGKASGSASGSGDAAVPEGRKEPAEKKPPSIKATVLVLGVLFLVMSPDVRWRVAEFNLFVRSSLPYGGNPPFGIRPGGTQPDMVIIESRFGANSELMSGRYFLLPEKVNRRYTWFKNSPGQEAYLLWDSCGAWLVSRFPTGNAPNCEGWAYSTRCYGMPWECAKTWMLREDGRWENAGSSVVVTPFFGEIPKAVTPECSPEQEEDLIEKFGKFDIVIPWINGSDPKWLADRARTCEDWQWREMWLDAVTRSRGTHDCLKEPDSVNEATALIAAGRCEKGIDGREGACVWGQLKVAPRGLTTRSSRCFNRFIGAHCTGRLNSIKDHDELRYLIRSVERHLSWHQGRILLITPNKATPSWLKPGGRLEVIAQEDILQAAVSSANFVNAAERGRVAEWAPDRIFNDYPVQAAFAFIPKATRVLMLLQDDLLFARPASICDFFKPDPAGLRLFARPFDGAATRDSFSQIYESMEQWTAKLFVVSTKAKDGSPSSYYRDLHMPHMLDTHLLEDLWRQYPEVMSDAASSSFRHPNLTNTIALHHSEAARRRAAGEAEGGEDDSVAKSQSDLDLRVDNLVMNISGPGPMHELPWMEVVFESVKDWHEKIAKLPPNSTKLPGIIGMQDNLGADMQNDIAELDCLREKWLNKLLPGHSSWEDPTLPPSLCRSRRSSKSKASAQAPRRVKEKTASAESRGGKDAEL